MESIEVELKVLIECLKKKEHTLIQIANITENQGFVLGSGAEHDEVYTFFMQMNEEKQVFINNVLQYDQVFENVLKKIGPTLDEDPSKYKEQVKTLQDLIRSVMDWDVKIRVLEESNNKTLVEALPKVKARADSEKEEKPESIKSGEYGSKKVIKAYKTQSRHHNE